MRINRYDIVWNEYSEQNNMVICTCPGFIVVLAFETIVHWASVLSHKKGPKSTNCT